MGRAKSLGPYTPLAENYYLDDAILEAGEHAELLFLRCLSYLASGTTDGYISELQMRHAVGVSLRAVPKRVEKLVEVGLLVRVDGGFVVRSYLKWNKSAEEIGRYRKQDRDRKARKQAEVDPNSDRNPGGVQPDSAPHFTALHDTALHTTPSRTDDDTTDAPEPPAARKRAARATRIENSTFEVTEALVVWAREHAPAVDGKVETLKFRNYWESKAGRDATKTDWSKTWQNWMLTAQQRAADRGWKASPTQTQMRTPAELRAEQERMMHDE